MSQDFGGRPVFPASFSSHKNAAKLALRTRHFSLQRSDSSPLKAHLSPRSTRWTKVVIQMRHYEYSSASDQFTSNIITRALAHPVLFKFFLFSVTFSGALTRMLYTSINWSVLRADHRNWTSRSESISAPPPGPSRGIPLSASSGGSDFTLTVGQSGFFALGLEALVDFRLELDWTRLTYN